MHVRLQPRNGKCILTPAGVNISPTPLKYGGDLTLKYELVELPSSSCFSNWKHDSFVYILRQNVPGNIVVSDT